VLARDQRGFAQLIDQDALVGRDAIIVIPAEQAERRLRSLEGRFKSIEIIGTASVPSGGAPALQLVVARGRGFSDPYD